MTVFARTGLKVLAFLLLLLLVIGFALTVTFKSDRFRNWLQAELSQKSGYAIHFADLALKLPSRVVIGSVEISKSNELHLKAHQLTVTLIPFDLVTKTIHRLDIEKPILQLDLQALMKSSATPSNPLVLRHLNVRSGTIVIKKGDDIVIELPNLNLAAANLDLREKSGIGLRADIPGLDAEAELQLKGQMRQLESDLIIRAKEKRDRFSSQAANRANEKSVRLHAKLSAPENQQASLIWESKFHDFAVGDSRITGAVKGQMEVDAKFTEATFKGRADIEGFPNTLMAAFGQLPSTTAVANFTGAYSIQHNTLMLKSLQLTSPIARGTGTAEVAFHTQPIVSKGQLELRDIPLDALKTLLPAPANQWLYNGHGELDVALGGLSNVFEITGIARSRNGQARSDAFTLQKFSFAAPFQWSNRGFHVQEAKLQATKLAYNQKGGWQAGVDQAILDGSLDYKIGEPLNLSAKLDAKGAKFASADSSRVGENFSLNGPVALKFNPDRKSITINGKFANDSGELLWGKVFADMKALKPVLDLDGDFSPDADTLELRRAQLHFASIGGWSASGMIARLSQTPQFHLQLRSSDFSPGGFYDFFLLETYKRQYPALERVALGGRMAFNFQLDGGLDTLTAVGEFSLKAGELRAKSNHWQLGPIALDLPIKISLADGKPNSAGAPRAGTLSIAGGRIAKQTLAPIETTLSLSDNGLRFLQPLRVGIFGGEIAVTDLAWPDIIHHPKQLSFSAEVKHLGLEDLTEAFGWPPFVGTVTGSIPEVQSTEDLLRTRGEIQAELFGGHGRISKLEIEGPFSSLASIKLTAALESIQLEQLSKTFAFGSISGVLQGTIDDLVLTDGQPSQLRADLHSVERSGIDQRISVEALNQITVLSSGQEAGALYSGLAGFFDSFRYSKLGFKATLKNDRLTLRGVESEGDKEYLVVGSWLPPTVNVVSHTQSIAFSELLRRLERIKSDKPEVK